MVTIPDEECPAASNADRQIRMHRATSESSDHGNHHSLMESVNDSINSLPPYEPTEVVPDSTQNGFRTGARLGGDGRVDINIITTNRGLSKLLKPALESQAQLNDDALPPFSPRSALARGSPLPRLNIVIQLVGSRGDIQPFVSLALELKTYGHRVRIATHPCFKYFVEDSGLEFFSIGGDPTELMAYMVKNPGLLPGFDTIVTGEVQHRRRSLYSMLQGCWRSCVEAGDGMDTNVPAILGTARRDPKPFVADALIANPPSFAHVHCAEKLGVPLHLVFTMPWSPTQAFSHPLANMQSSDADLSLSNYLSYILVDMMIWQGVGSVVNAFRRKTLGLEPIDSTWALTMIPRLKIPHTYCWSSSLIPKPRDWAPHLDVAGFCFLFSKTTYVPSAELVSFLKDGAPPVYIGFGSIVVDDPKALTSLILEAIRLAGVRAVMGKGWADLGNSVLLPPNVFMVDNCPHDWLFQHVSCVIHHGGAGTTSVGVYAGKPTVIVPFFGDQMFWGEVISRTKAGPDPILFKTLTAGKLAAAIANALRPATVENALRLGATITRERGSETAAKSFHDRLPLDIMGCSIRPQQPAVWRLRKSHIKLSALAATVLRKEGLLSPKELEIYRPCEYDLHHGPWDPVSGGLLAVTGLFYNVFKGIGEMGSDLGRVHTSLDSLGRRPTTNLVYSSSASSTRPPNSANENDKVIGHGLMKGTGRIFKAAVRSPGDFTLAMTQGAHNLPKVWGDTTVRPQDKITGIGSGLVAAAKELTLGTYDGISGLFIQPIIGARDGGVLGAMKGIMKGIAGTPVKFMAAMSGTVGYSLKGVDVEITRALRRMDQDEVSRSRMEQGEWEFRETSEEETKEIIERWLQDVVPMLNKQRIEKRGKAKIDASE